MSDLHRRVVENVRRLREQRRWTAAELAAAVHAEQPELNRSVIANLETGRRDMITVNELAALARAFGVSPWSLTDEPNCLTCSGQPPAGFACRNCGAAS